MERDPQESVPVRSLSIGAGLVAAIGFVYLAICAAGYVQNGDPPPWVCVGAIIAGLAMLGEIRLRDRLSIFIILAAGIVLFAIGTIFAVEDASGADFHVDTLLFPRELAHGTTHPGRPAGGTAFNFLLIAAGMILMRRKNRVLVIAREITAIASIVFCYFSLTGSLMSWIGTSRQDQTMLPVTAAMILVTAVCILFYDADGHLRSLLTNTGPGGVFARWLIPVAFILPVATPLVRVMGVRLHLFGAQASGRLVSFIDILVAILIVWRSSTQVLIVDRQRKAAEDALRASRDELDERVKLRTVEMHKANLTLSAVIANSPLAICTLDREGRVKERNAAAEAMSIGSDHELAGLIERALAGERISSVLVVRPAGVHLNVWAVPIIAEDDQFDGVLLMAADVSEKTKLEAQMLQTQKLESLGLLAGGIAHDFNNLLTGVMGNASLALENLSADDESRPLLDQVVASSERAAELTRQLLAYAGKGRFVVDHVNLSDLVRETSALVHASIPRAVELRFDMERDLPLIEADASQIQQIIMNLVINAAEAIADSGIVEISTKRVAIVSDEELEPGCYVCLEITDTGCGMDADTQAKIFDPFFTTKFTGRGLGLAAVQGIVRSHKGALRLRSVLGQGTVFKVLFPASELRRLESAERNQERKEQRGAGIVLIIDDEPVVGRVATGALSQLGYQVRTASSGYEGLAAFAENYQEIRVVLLDLTMPGLSSKEIFAKLKAVKPNVPVILSSGFSEMEVLKSFTADSISGFLQKPYTAAQLRDVIGAAISEPLADQPRPSSLSFAPGSVA